MAASMVRQVSQEFNRSLFSSALGLPAVTSVRYRSKKKGGRSKNLGGKRATVGKSYGIKRNDGNFVHKGEILVNQCGLRFYPGENVDIDRTNRLIALTDGTVIVSCEKLNPYPNSPLYRPVQNGLEIYKKFFHVIPIPLKAKFKLVSET
ncbi:large ribosomal subunit protein bL27m-like [Saccostrea echinata]|uniref:large ribosomal subunit protein bL27m-like n=1 Tax=Saccostrea echinata TaxID=191078 RepID=UPI002A82C74A|nr:large ribosomal subunit protein bL27m-like [Saccostrea echinata]